jgi:hypothetical protein
MDDFLLKSIEKTFDDGFVVKIPSATHTWLDALLAQLCLLGITSISTVTGRV